MNHKTIVAIFPILVLLLVGKWAFGAQSTISPYTSPLQTNKNVAGKNNFNSVRDDANTDIQALRSAQQTMNSDLYTGKQNRVTGTCVSGQAVQSIAVDGTVTCGASSTTSCASITATQSG